MYINLTFRYASSRVMLQTLQNLTQKNLKGCIIWNQKLSVIYSSWLHRKIVLLDWSLIFIFPNCCRVCSTLAPDSTEPRLQPYRHLPQGALLTRHRWQPCRATTWWQLKRRATFSPTVQVVALFFGEEAALQLWAKRFTEKKWPVQWIMEGNICKHLEKNMN